MQNIQKIEYINDQEITFEILKNELYIEPTTCCNLNCRMCYVNVLNGNCKKELQEKDILDFIDKFVKLNDNNDFKINWCGTGEVFLYTPFTKIINLLNDKFNGRIEQLIITNGTINRLKEIDDLTNINFQVSIDGLEENHNWNRGNGNYKKSVDFCKEALKLNCKSLKINSLITKENLPYITQFVKTLKKEIGDSINFTFLIPLTNKQVKALSNSYVSPKIDTSKVIDYVDLIKYVNNSNNEIKRLVSYGKITVPLYLSVNPSGISCCCENEIKLGNLNSDICELMVRLENSIELCKKCPLFKTYCILNL